MGTDRTLRKPTDTFTKVLRNKEGNNKKNCPKLPGTEKWKILLILWTFAEAIGERK